MSRQKRLLMLCFWLVLSSFVPHKIQACDKPSWEETKQWLQETMDNWHIPICWKQRNFDSGYDMQESSTFELNDEGDVVLTKITVSSGYPRNKVVIKFNLAYIEAAYPRRDKENRYYQPNFRECSFRLVRIETLFNEKHIEIISFEETSAGWVKKLNYYGSNWSFKLKPKNFVFEMKPSPGNDVSECGMYTVIEDKVPVLQKLYLTKQECFIQTRYTKKYDDIEERITRALLHGAKLLRKSKGIDYFNDKEDLF